jgi:hypothetical protein
VNQEDEYAEEGAGDQQLERRLVPRVVPPRGDTGFGA